MQVITAMTHQEDMSDCKFNWLKALPSSWKKLGSNPGQGSKGIQFSGWHGLDMSIIVTKRR